MEADPETSEPGPTAPASHAPLLYGLSIGCGIWFLLTSWMWTYLACLFISYPVGLIGLFLWGLGRMEAPASKAGRLAIGLHLLGLATSILALALFK